MMIDFIIIIIVREWEEDNLQRNLQILHGEQYLWKVFLNST